MHRVSAPAAWPTPQTRGGSIMALCPALLQESRIADCRPGTSAQTQRNPTAGLDRGFNHSRATGAPSFRAQEHLRFHGPGCLQPTGEWRLCGSDIADEDSESFDRDQSISSQRDSAWRISWRNALRCSMASRVTGLHRGGLAHLCAAPSSARHAKVRERASELR